jgi:uncharacterized protein YndB with AHSA1/START domain
MLEGTARITIARPRAEVFSAVTDVSRMGEWSPECTGGSWDDPATGPAAGATFTGHNEAKVGPVVLKRWTTRSEVTAYEQDSLFEFVTEGTTTWRYEFEDDDSGTLVTESYSSPPYQGWERLVYGVLAQRSKNLLRGVEETLARMKQRLEE